MSERCPICDWPIVPVGEPGCWKDNCSYRPEQGSPEWYRIEVRRKAATPKAAGESGKESPKDG